jgi:pimeloyl-ACP methyl ester carboxylesterase
VGDDRQVLNGIPARVFRPEDPAPGLVLLGHGGAADKDHPSTIALGRRYSDQLKRTTVCIDMDGYGERLTGERPDGRQALIDWMLASTERTVADWIAAAGALASDGPPVGYVGFSMGALLGAPTVVAMPTIAAAVFGVGGLPAAASDPAAVLAVARRLGGCQVLMLNMTQDRTFPPEHALRYFDAIPGRKKRLAFWEGEHDGLPAEAIRQSVAFLQRHLPDA